MTLTGNPIIDGRMQNMQSIMDQNAHLHEQMKSILKGNEIQLSCYKAHDEKLDWLQAQANLFLCFILSEQASAERFALVVKSIAESTEDTLSNEKRIAQLLLSAEWMQKHLEPLKGLPLDSVGAGLLARTHQKSDVSAPRSNVIQFPGPPKPPKKNR